MRKVKNEESGHSFHPSLSYCFYVGSSDKIIQRDAKGISGRAIIKYIIVSDLVRGYGISIQDMLDMAGIGLLFPRFLGKLFVR